MTFAWRHRPDFEGLRSIRLTSEVALYHLASAGHLPHSDLKDRSWCYWDAMDLACDGITAESVDDVVKDMIATLTGELDRIKRNSSA